jgi:hypothetical protein
MMPGIGIEAWACRSPEAAGMILFRADPTSNTP